MNEDDCQVVTDKTLAWLREVDGDSTILISSLLGAEEMGPEDYARNEQEVADYLDSGDIGAARALIQHAKARRESARDAVDGN